MVVGMEMSRKGRTVTTTTTIIVLQLQAILVVAAGAGVEPSMIGRRVPAVYVFGDSTLDVGNNNYLEGKDVPRANKPYYGIDFPGSKPTGRFSNGYNIADYVAMSLGFNKSPLAYLMLKAHNYLIPTALTMGVSFASAGAGILDSTNAGGNIPLSKQVAYFRSTRAEMAGKVGSGVVSKLLAKSFFLVGVGSNDMFAFAAAQQQSNRSATPAELVAFHDSLISNYSAAITELYEMGARKIGIINVGPVGCAPRVRAASATAGACNDGMNKQLAEVFDGNLGALMAGLAARLPGLAYSVGDSYGLTQATFADPAAAGLRDVQGACCGSGRLGGEGECQLGAALCGDRDRYAFWDRVHPTQQAAKLSARAFFDGPARFTTPINFSHLANYTY